MIGCKKEKTCNCGLVSSNNQSDYSVVIAFKETSDWMNAYVGSDYCITNTTSW
jgi:hypothetical protein